MENYKVKQIKPNHADHITYYKEKYVREMIEKEPVICQPKYDGERMLVHFNGNEIYTTSRRISKKTGYYMENQDKLPKLQNLNLPGFGYTVIDCECYAKDWSEVVGVLHSLPERAIELQKTVNVKFAVFDCLFYNGKDIRDLEYFNRLAYAMSVVELLNNKDFHLVKFEGLNSYDEIEEQMNRSLSLGFEGIVLKSFDRKYYDKGACLKVKKFETVDCVVCGYQEGTGKYEGLIGALEIGYYDENLDKIIKISKVNCGTDEERIMWTEKWDKMKNSVIEVKCQEVTEKSLRHPVYVRLREDKDYKMCTKNTIFKE